MLSLILAVLAYLWTDVLHHPHRAAPVDGPRDEDEQWWDRQYGGGMG